MSKGKPNQSMSKETTKRGAPKGNVNAVSKGITFNKRTDIDRHGLILGELPKRVKQVQLYGTRLRKSLEQIVLTHKGRLTIIDQAHITTACRWERHAQLANRWMGEKYEELSILDRLQLSKAVADASTNRDKALEKLQLDKEEVKTLTLIDYVQDQHKDQDA